MSCVSGKKIKDNKSQSYICWNPKCIINKVKKQFVATAPKCYIPNTFFFTPEQWYYATFESGYNTIPGFNNRFGGDTNEFQRLVEAIYQDSFTNDQFGKKRYALLFSPGTYNITIHVNYYMTIMGLGLSPSQVIINKVYSNGNNGSETHSFWRSCENITTGPTQWCVSQTSPLNNMIINGEVDLGNCGYSSGGFIGNSTIDKTIDSGSQQQWFTLNSQLNGWIKQVWNLGFLGCTGDLNKTNCVSTIEDTTPLIAGKPYLYCNDLNTDIDIVKPIVESQKTGLLKQPAIENLYNNIYLADPNKPDDINKYGLDSGKNIILTPGIYYLKDSLTISKSDTVILGLGMATLVAKNDIPALIVNDGVEGVRLSSFIIQSGYTGTTSTSNVLLQIGETITDGSEDNPIIIDNICVRVGPEDTLDETISVETMMEINSGWVITSNIWLWRADHGPYGPIINKSICNNGLIVNGDNVYCYGLFAEHAIKNIIQWNGNNGSIYFLQSEYPYDITNAGDLERPCLNVNKSTGYGANFKGYGLGIYCNFQVDPQPTINTAIRCPDDAQITNACTVFLTGGGGIKHVIDDNGGSVSNANRDNAVYISKTVNPTTYPPCP
jgi:hypothetical protein